MALSRQKKEEIVKKVTDIMKNTESVVFVNFHGLSVSDTSEMRQDLAQKGVGYTVAKKTLVKRVLKAQNVAGEQPSFEGELALAYSDDMVAPASGIAAFQKKFQDAVAPLGGVLEGRYIGKEEVIRLASIPSREVLYGQLVTVMNAPIQQTVGVLNAVTQSFVSALYQISIHR